jgi:DNA-binding response OmpR family regulator
MDTKQSLVLLIEDDRAIREMYERKFSHEQITYISAATGPDGWKAIVDNHPALVLLDVMLPGGMNGFDILEKLKRDETLKSIPVIMLTNLSQEEQTARQIGVEEYVTKANLSLDDLVVKIRKYVQ